MKEDEKAALDRFMQVCRECDAAKLVSLGPEIYQRTDRLSIALAAARDALLSKITEEEVNELRASLYGDIERRLAELDA